jgi:membrane associated rhomboid family serine protease
MKPEVVLYALMGLIGVVTYKAFNDPLFKEKLVLRPMRVTSDNEYWRLFTSGFIHADWMHLGFNMYVMYGFGENLALKFPEVYGAIWPLYLIGLFVFGVFFANLTTTLKERNNVAYASLGASGGVSSILFAFIVMFPERKLGLLLLPKRLWLPGYAFGILYLIYCQYMAKKKRDNINHNAHFWGAIFGVLFVFATQPHTIETYILKFNLIFN